MGLVILGYRVSRQRDLGQFDEVMVRATGLVDLTVGQCTTSSNGVAAR